jgi:hypothetical protein
VGQHDHTWQFGHGNTFPLWSCSLGLGNSLTGQIMSDHVAKFIQNVAEFESHDEANKWLRLTLDAQTSRDVFGAILTEQFPENGFTNVEEYKRWSAAHLLEMDEFITETIELENRHRNP